MTNKAQATLEFTVVFAIMVFLLLGMLSLWKWSSDKIVNRQVKYNSERLKVGARDVTPDGVAKLIKLEDNTVVSVGGGGGAW